MCLICPWKMIKTTTLKNKASLWSESNGNHENHQTLELIILERAMTDAGHGCVYSIKSGQGKTTANE